jgi:hypothetical protein
MSFVGPTMNLWDGIKQRHEHVRDGSTHFGGTVSLRVQPVHWLIPSLYVSEIVGDSMRALGGSDSRYGIVESTVTQCARSGVSVQPEPGGKYCSRSCCCNSKKKSCATLNHTMRISTQ